MTNEPAGVNSPGESARVWANPKARIALMCAFGGIILLLIWRVMAPPDKNQNLKSRSEMDLEKIVDNSTKEGKDDKGKPVNIQKQASDQPAGDPEAISILNTVDARNAAAAKRKADAEEQAMAMLAYQNFSRKQQGLSHDPALAAAWETRMAQASSEGKTLAAPSEISAENLEELKKTNPELYAKWIAIQGGSPKVAQRGPDPSAAGRPQGKVDPRALVAGGQPGSIPPGINPKTGLPEGVPGTLQVPGMAGIPSDVVYALADDGTPDIANGAIPVQIQYTPPGSTQPVTITKWIRPGYLTGRVRPVDPRIALEEDDAYRRSMKDSTDIPVDTQHAPVSIPFRYTNAKVRVTSGDFHFENRYVVVLPNPKGKLSPPNPPVPNPRGAK